MFYNFLFMVLSIIIFIGSLCIIRDLVYTMIKRLSDFIKKALDVLEHIICKLKEKIIQRSRQKRKQKTKGINIGLILNKLRCTFSKIRSSNRKLLNIVAVSIWLLAALIVTQKVTLLSESFIIRITIVLFLVVIVGAMVFLLYMMKSTHMADKFIGVFIFAYIILIISLLFVQQGSKISERNEAQFISIIVLLLVVVAVFYYGVTIYINKWVGIGLILAVYTLILLIGSIGFGSYYFNIYKESYILEASMINENNNGWLEIVIFFKIGIRYFFEFPSSTQLGKISLLHFVIGKIGDLIFLGYIVSRIMDMNIVRSTTKIKGD